MLTKQGEFSSIKAIYLLNFCSGWSMCPATVWIIFTRIPNVILES